MKPTEVVTYGEVYVNDVAAAVFNSKEFLFSTLVPYKQSIVFPVGSIIVREKLVENLSTKSLNVTSLAVMIKHDISNSPKSGGWRFFYISPKDFSITKNDQALCLSCHERQQSEDFVFRSYLPKE